MTQAKGFNPGNHPTKRLALTKEDGGIMCDVDGAKTARFSGPYRAERIFMLTNRSSKANVSFLNVTDTKSHAVENNNRAIGKWIVAP